MSDFEDRLRESLRDAVPSNLDTRGLAAGAERYAVRARRVRVLGAVAALALVLAVAGTTASWFGHEQRPPAPATPSPVWSNTSTLECGANPRTTRPPSPAVTPFGDVMARLCPAPGAGPAGEGWTLPAQPLRTDTWISYLRGGLVAEDPAKPCPVSAAALGPAFTVTIQRLDGQLLSYRSADLACQGRDAVARYLTAMAFERADIEASATTGNAIHCAAPKDDGAKLASGPLPGASFRRPQAVLCLYPEYAPRGSDRLVERPYQRVELTADQVAVLNEDLQGATLRTPTEPACTGSHWLLVLKMVNPGSHEPDGEEVEYRSRCSDRLYLQDHRLEWRPGQWARKLVASFIPLG